MATVPLQQLDGGPLRVLLVEDETFVRMDVAEACRQAGFEVIEAAEVDAAMEFIEAGGQVDVVFTDVQTPGLMNGLALAERNYSGSGEGHPRPPAACKIPARLRLSGLGSSR